MPYKNQKTGNIISDTQFNCLIAEDKANYVYQDEGEEDAGYDAGLDKDEDIDFLSEEDDEDED